MQIPPTITFRHLPASDALDADVRRRLGKLEMYCRSLMHARVLIEAAGSHHRAGNRYHVRIDLTVPGEEIAVSHDASLRAGARALGALKTRKSDEPDPAHKLLGVVIREAFDVARRRLQDYVRRQRGAVKTHVPLPEGRVVRLAPTDSHGFLEAPDGHEVYFHKHSVLDDRFDTLQVGSRVAFVEEPGDRGPQASTVRVLR